MKQANYLLQTCLLFAIITSSALLSAAKMTKNEMLSQQITGSALSNASLKRNQQPALLPAALIRDLYRTHAKNSSAIVQGKNRAILNKYFDKNLADLIWKDITTHQDEVGVIDFDLFYDAQDIAVSNLVVGAAQIDGDSAKVSVTFKNYNRRNKLTYLLIKENSLWKIADIYYSKNETLLHYFG